MEVFGNGTLDVSDRGRSLTIGSLEGDGLVFLGNHSLSIGTNALSTIFSGVIQDGGISGETGGSLGKVGTGTLTLNGANTYTKGTTVTQGTLIVNNINGSATGPGPVRANGGTLGGSGLTSGKVTIGTGSGPGAFLAPGAQTSKQVTLNIQSALTFNGDSTYKCTFKAQRNNAHSDQVVANGVTINSGASFIFSGRAQAGLHAGLTLTVISNTSAKPIADTFANLPDGGIINVDGNNFQANYEGGDGNDLTLTVVP